MPSLSSQFDPANPLVSGRGLTLEQYRKMEAEGRHIDTMSTPTIKYHQHENAPDLDAGRPNLRKNVRSILGEQVGHTSAVQ
jgi:hypothetical protein